MTDKRTIETDQPEKLDLRSHDVAEKRRQEFLRLFPEVRTEGGRIDFERLKLALGDTVDVGVASRRVVDTASFVDIF